MLDDVARLTELSDVLTVDVDLYAAGVPDAHQAPFLPWNVLEVPAGNVPSMLTFPSTVTRSHEGAERTKASELARPPAAGAGVAAGRGRRPGR